MIPILAALRSDGIATLLLVGAVVAAGGTAWVWRYQVGHKAGSAAVQAQWDADKLRRSEANLRAISELVAERDAQQRRADHAVDTLVKVRADNARVVAELRANADQLRDAILQYAGGIEAADDNLQACRGRAVALGELLGSALRDGQACAERGESDSAIARALSDAWPVSKP